MILWKKLQGGRAGVEKIEPHRAQKRSEGPAVRRLFASVAPKVRDGELGGSNDKNQVHCLFWVTSVSASISRFVKGTFRCIPVGAVGTPRIPCIPTEFRHSAGF